MSVCEVVEAEVVCVSVVFGLLVFAAAFVVLAAAAFVVLADVDFAALSVLASVVFDFLVADSVLLVLVAEEDFGAVSGFGALSVFGLTSFCFSFDSLDGTDADVDCSDAPFDPEADRALGSAQTGPNTMATAKSALSTPCSTALLTPVPVRMQSFLSLSWSRC
ncbi:MAG: hypothetical protein JOZ81_13015 [Chloroflexi bacterium]|nr:hypothetical protein [Chloroflexota bacterium]